MCYSCSGLPQGDYKRCVIPARDSLKGITNDVLFLLWTPSRGLQTMCYSAWVLSNIKIVVRTGPNEDFVLRECHSPFPYMQTLNPLVLVGFVLLCYSCYGLLQGDYKRCVIPARDSLKGITNDVLFLIGTPSNGITNDVLFLL
jgi:hypothetical protein